MHPTNAMLLARQMLDAQGLHGWSFKINTNKRRLGVCKFNHRRIEISMFHLNDGEDAVKDTIAHEVAHAVVGVGHGHNNVWRSKAIELGSSGQRCGAGMTAVPFKWIATCPSCGKVRKCHRKPKRARSCGSCCPRVYNPAYQFVFTLNRNDP